MKLSGVLGELDRHYKDNLPHKSIIDLEYAIEEHRFPIRNGDMELGRAIHGEDSEKQGYISLELVLPTDMNRMEYMHRAKSLQSELGRKLYQYSESSGEGPTFGISTTYRKRQDKNHAGKHSIDVYIPEIAPVAGNESAMKSLDNFVSDVSAGTDLDIGASDKVKLHASAHAAKALFGPIAFLGFLYTTAVAAPFIILRERVYERAYKNKYSLEG